MERLGLVPGRAERRERRAEHGRQVGRDLPRARPGRQGEHRRLVEDLRARRQKGAPLGAARAVGHVARERRVGPGVEGPDVAGGVERGRHERQRRPAHVPEVLADVGVQPLGRPCTPVLHRRLEARRSARSRPSGRPSRRSAGRCQRAHIAASEEVIELREGQLRRRPAAQQLRRRRGPRRSPGSTVIFGSASLCDHVALADAPAAAAPATMCLPSPSSASPPSRAARCETNAMLVDPTAPPVRAEHRPHAQRLRRRNRRVRVAHLRPGDEAPLEDELGSHAEERRPPQDQVGPLADGDAPDLVRHAVRDGRVDRVLGDVALDARVVVVAALARRGARDRGASCRPSARCG